MATATRNSASPHALRDVVGGDRDKAGNLTDKIPGERFGTGRAKLLRKFVLIAIAKSADRDGSNAYPSMETIARRCLVSIEAVRKTIKWLVEHELLDVESKAMPTSRYGRTNKYTILFSEHIPIEVVGASGKHLPIEVVGASDQALTTMDGWNTTSEAWNTNRKPTMTVPLDSPLTVYEGSSHGVQNPDTPFLKSKPHSADEDQSKATTTPSSHPVSAFSTTLPAPPAPDADAILPRVWDYYLSVTGKDPLLNRLTAGRRKIGIARLRDCLTRTKGDYVKAEQLMKCAIDGIMRSDWHAGRDAKTNGKRYCEWERNIFKTEEQMELLWN